MGLMALFGKGPLSDKKIEKIAKLAANPFAQPDVRMREMARLIDDGSPAALRGLLKRLASNANGHIADEEEKQWLEDKLVTLGQVVREPLEEYIRSESKLTYALRAYQRLVGEADAVAFFLKVLQSYGPEAYRAGEAKLQLIWALSELTQFEQVHPVLVPFVRDHSDDVSWAVMDILDKAASQQELAAEVVVATCSELAHLVLEDSAGPRIQQRAAELLCQHAWEVPGEATDLAPLLDETYFLDKKRFVRRRARR